MTSRDTVLPALRVGIGYDSHRLAPGRPLVLGGIVIEHEMGLEGHSDADVLCHAITDAIMGAAAAGDIGQRFPDSDERWRGADSLELLGSVLAELSVAVVNIDATIVCERPRIAPHRDEIVASLERVVGAPVSLKATTAEGMGAIGRGEGMAAHAVALIELRRAPRRPR